MVNAGGARAGGARGAGVGGKAQSPRTFSKVTAR